MYNWNMTQDFDRRASQVSADFPDAFYRVAVKGMLVRDYKVLMVDDFAGKKARERGGEWELPGGGLDFGEDMHQALVREVQEEMGLKVTWVADRPAYIWTVKRHARRGMEWFYVLVVAFQIEVENLEFTPSEECRSITFMSKDDMVANRAKIADQLHPLIDLFNPADFKA